MTNSLLIVGAGGHGRVVADAALLLGYRRIAFLDDHLFESLGAPGSSTVKGVDVLGPCSLSAQLAQDWQAAIVAFGDNRRRLTTLTALESEGFELPALVHPSSVISQQAELGGGVFVAGNAVVNIGSVLAKGVIVNTAATVDHDCHLAAGCHVSPGAHLAGGVHVGQRSWVGIGSTVKQGVKIGDDVTVGAGAVVLNDVLDGLTVAGVPAQTLPN